MYIFINKSKNIFPTLCNATILAAIFVQKLLFWQLFLTLEATKATIFSVIRQWQPCYCKKQNG